KLFDVETPQAGNVAAFDAVLRHDLKTPVSAILGYSEMVIEDFAEALPVHVLSDLSKVVYETRKLLAQIDETPDSSAPNEGQAPSVEFDGMIAANLVRTMADRSPLAAERAGRILIVDDTLSNRDLLCRRLGREGHVVVAAASGEEALRIICEQ